MCEHREHRRGQKSYVTINDAKMYNPDSELWAQFFFSVLSVYVLCITYNGTENLHNCLCTQRHLHTMTMLMQRAVYMRGDCKPTNLNGCGVPVVFFAVICLNNTGLCHWPDITGQLADKTGWLLGTVPVLPMVNLDLAGWLYYSNYITLTQSFPITWKPWCQTTNVSP